MAAASPGGAALSVSSLAATSPATPLALHCTLCKLTTNSANDLERHLMGARHRKAVAHTASAAAAPPAAAAVAAPRSLISSSSSSAVVPPTASAVPSVTAVAVAADPLSGCPKPCSTALLQISSIYPTQELAVQRETIDTQGEQDSMAQKKVGFAPSASSNSNKSAALHCMVCHRSFKREVDLHTHLSSKQHEELLAAFDRGASHACSFSFTLVRSALLYYPAASSEVTSKELPAHQAEFAARLGQFIDGKNAQKSLPALQHSLARKEWDAARARFLSALEGGLSSLATQLRSDGELGESRAIADAEELDDEYANVWEGDDDWQEDEEQEY